MRVLTQALRLGLVLAVVPAVSRLDRAEAAPVDLAASTCEDAVRGDADERRQLALWLAGYYAGTSGRPVVDQDKVSAAAEALAQVCARRRDLPLIGTEIRALIAGEVSATQLAPPPPAPPPVQQKPAPAGRSAPRPLPAR